MEYITSTGNKIYKEVKKLSLKKYREALSLYIEEGDKQLLSKDDIQVEYIVLSKDKEISPHLEEKLKKIKEQGKNIYIFDEKLFSELSTQENSQGLIAIKKIKNSCKNNLSDIIVALDGVQDPGNMGTIFRTVDAVGLKDIFLLEGCVDIYNPKTVRSSMGSIEELNLIKITQEELETYKDKGYKLKSTGMSSKSKPYTEINPNEKSIIIFGSEGQGVSSFIKNIVDEEIEIPIYGRSESLNVGIATGIILYKIREKLS